jgi:hypothetical protein
MTPYLSHICTWCFMNMKARIQEAIDVTARKFAEAGDLARRNYQARYDMLNDELNAIDYKIEHLEKKGDKKASALMYRLRGARVRRHEYYMGLIDVKPRVIEFMAAFYHECFFRGIELDKECLEEDHIKSINAVCFPDIEIQKPLLEIAKSRKRVTLRDIDALGEALREGPLGEYMVGTTGLGTTLYNAQKTTYDALSADQVKKWLHGANGAVRAGAHIVIKFAPAEDRQPGPQLQSSSAEAVASNLTVR